MKALKVILIIVGILIATMLIVPLFSPSTVMVSAEIEIELTPEQVFKGVASFENRDKWDPWVGMDSTTVVTIHSEPEYVGSYYEWNGERLGTGKMQVDAIEMNTYISSSLWFGDVETPSLVEWTFEEVGESTHAVWSFTEETSYPIGRLRMMIGKVFLKKSFDTGLANLKEYLEANPPVLIGLGEIEIDTFSPVNTMVTESSGTMDQIEQLLGKSFAMVMSEIGKQGLETAGPPFAIYSDYDETIGSFKLTAGMPVVKLGKKSGKVYPKRFEEMEMVIGVHTGPYQEFASSYRKLDAYIIENDIDISGEAVEIYLSDPGLERDQNKLKTLLGFPIKK